MRIFEYLRELNMISMTFRIVLAALVGGILGIERGRKNRPAGFRTYSLVCLGSALVMMTNQYICEAFESGSDPARLGAQVISGIGFLGAGTIILTGKNQVKGLTTAASLWTAGCLGLAVGIGFYEGALLGALVIMITLSVLQRFDSWVRKNSRYIDLYIEYDEKKNAFSEFLFYARENQFEISNIQASREEYYCRERGQQRIVSYTLTVYSSERRSHEEMMGILNNAKGIQYIEEL